LVQQCTNTEPFIAVKATVRSYISAASLHMFIELFNLCVNVITFRAAAMASLVFMTLQLYFGRESLLALVTFAVLLALVPCQ